MFVISFVAMPTSWSCDLIFDWSISMRRKRKCDLRQRTLSETGRGNKAQVVTPLKQKMYFYTNQHDLKKGTFIKLPFVGHVLIIRNNGSERLTLGSYKKHVFPLCSPKEKKRDESLRPR